MSTKSKKVRNPQREAIRRLVALRNILNREATRLGLEQDAIGTEWSVSFTSKVAIVEDGAGEVTADTYKKIAGLVIHSLDQLGEAVVDKYSGAIGLD